MKHVSYHVDVRGIIWQGIEASYSYTFDRLPSDEDIRRKAGDFQFLTDWQITRHESRSKTDKHGVWREMQTRKVVRKFREAA